MDNPVLNRINQKILSLDDAVHTVSNWKKTGETIVFTNGCFDIIHFGHISYLSKAKDLGSKLVVAINSPDSVQRLKGPNRPINDLKTRTFILAAFEFIDLVTVFEEDSPLEIIKMTVPDVLVKGGDWNSSEIIGSEIVLSAGGKVLSLPFISGYSTSLVEDKIKSGSTTPTTGNEE